MKHLKEMLTEHIFCKRSCDKNRNAQGSIPSTSKQQFSQPKYKQQYYSYRISVSESIKSFPTPKKKN